MQQGALGTCRYAIVSILLHVVAQLALPRDAPKIEDRPIPVELVRAICVDRILGKDDVIHPHTRDLVEDGGTLPSGAQSLPIKKRLAQQGASHHGWRV